MDKQVLPSDLGNEAGEGFLKKALEKIFGTIGEKPDLQDERYSFRRIDTLWAIYTDIETSSYTNTVAGKIDSNSPRFSSEKGCLEELARDKRSMSEKYRQHLAVCGLIKEGKYNAVVADLVSAIQERYCDGCSGNGSLTCNNCAGNGSVRCPHCDYGYNRCHGCWGTGRQPDPVNNRTVRCSTCMGEGRKRCITCDYRFQVRCNSCGGSGHQGCNTCSSTGILSDCYCLKVETNMTTTLLKPQPGPEADLVRDDVLNWIKSGGLSNETTFGMVGISQHFSDLTKQFSKDERLITGLTIDLTEATLDAKFSESKVRGRCLVLPAPVIKFNKFLDGKKEQLLKFANDLSKKSPKEFIDTFEQKYPLIKLFLTQKDQKSAVALIDSLTYQVFGAEFFEQIADDYKYCRKIYTDRLGGETVVLPLIAIVALWFAWMAFLQLPWNFASIKMAFYLILPFIVSLKVIGWNTRRVLKKQTGHKNELKLGAKAYVIPLASSLLYLVAWYVLTGL